MQISRRKKGGRRFSSSARALVCFPAAAAALLLLFLFFYQPFDDASRKATYSGKVIDNTEHIRHVNATSGLSLEVKQSDASFDYLRSFTRLENTLVFFHVPKTAGTAIEFVAGTRKIPWGSCLFSHKPKRDVCRYPEGGEWPGKIGWWHVPRQFFPLMSIDPYQMKESFAVVRDSYDRMVSEYLYICTLKVLEWRPNQCDRDRLNDKEYMNEWLQSKIKDRETDTPLAYLQDNGHFTPQYEFIVGPNEVRMIDYVLRLNEDLSTQFATLMQSFFLGKVGLKKLNALGAQDRDSFNLSPKDLDEETMNWIHNRYINDFDLGYERKEIS